MNQNNRRVIEKKVDVKTPRQNSSKTKIINPSKNIHHSPHLADVLSFLFHRRKRRVFVEKKKTAALHGLSRQFVFFLLLSLTATVTMLTLFVMWQMRLAWYEDIWQEKISSINEELTQNIKSENSYLDEQSIQSQYSQVPILDLQKPWQYKAFYRLPSTQTQELLILIGGEKKEEKKIMVYENEHPYFNRSILIKCLLAVVFFTVTLTALLLLWFRQKFINPLYHTVQAIHRFTDDPNNLMTMLIASDREDEIGFLQRELTRMQVMYRISLKQYQHLAALGAAVTKINHDLKGLLSTALLAGENINKSADPKTQKKIHLFITIVERTIKLCGQLLSYVREEKTTFITRVDLNTLLKSLSADLRIVARGETKIKTKLQITRPIQGDADDLYRAFRNIGQNAVEAKAKELAIMLKGDGKHVHVNFADDGPGLSIEASKSLFKAFAHSSKVGGSGLGLSISQELIKQHGGSLTLAKSGDKGTTFHCVFPIALGTKKEITIQ